MSSHGKVLLSLLKNRKHTVGCEVGVHAGETTGLLLKKLPTIKRYYAIDPWEIYEMYDGSMYRKPGNKKYKTFPAAKKNFYKLIKPFKKRVTIYAMTSVEAAKHIPKDSLDWVFIDANHEYEYIKENLRIWTIKVKHGGLVAGHDYGNKWKGIKQAVDEFVPKNKLKISPHTVWSCVRGEF